MCSDIVLLDATLRDGGLVNNHYFEDDLVRSLYQMNIEAGTDYMEFGYRADRKQFNPIKYGKWKYSSDEDIRAIVGDNKTSLKISIMADAGRCDYKKDIHDKSESPVDLIRVATYIDTISEAVQMIEYADRKGYETTCNIMAISKCSYAQLSEALDLILKSPAKGAYIVDSFGAIYPNMMKEYVQFFSDRLRMYGKFVGIHAHNNQQCAFANTIEALDVGAKWLDATAYGMGRGAGNCHLEALIGYLNNSKYHIEPVLEFVGKKMIPLKNSGTEWGYNMYYLMTGLKNKHPSSAIAATKANDMDFVQFNNKLCR